MIKDFTAYNHGKGVIDLRDIGSATQMMPTEIHLKEDGSLDNKPSFTIILEHPLKKPVYGQITLEMLNDGLEDIGYKMVKQPKTL